LAIAIMASFYYTAFDFLYVLAEFWGAPQGHQEIPLQIKSQENFVKSSE
jgi:hypothetical protein